MIFYEGNIVFLSQFCCGCHRQTEGKSGILKTVQEKGGTNMTILALVSVVAVLLGVAVVWAKVNDPRNGVSGCCGCGQCARTGECVMVRKKAAGKGESPS